MKKLILLTLYFFSNILYGQNESIFWRAQKDSLNIYILGSNHLYPIDSISNKEFIDKIILKSDVFFIELDSNSNEIDSIFKNRKDNNIKRYLGDSYNLYKSLFPNYKYSEKLTPKEVWVQLNKKRIALSCKYSDDKKMEEYFIKIAKSMKKKIIEFEESKEQLKQMDDFFKYSDNKMWAYNKDILKKINENDLKDECIDGAKIINNKYKYEFDKKISEDNKQIWDNRNIKWLEKLEEEILINYYKNIFIMVGIGHLDYSNGLIVLLKNKGFTVKPINL